MCTYDSVVSTLPIACNMSAAEEIATPTASGQELLQANQEALETWQKQCTSVDYMASVDSVRSFLSQDSWLTAGNAGATGADSSAGWFLRALSFAVCCCYERAQAGDHKWTSLLSSFKLRIACRADVPALLSLIKELAEFEKAPDAVETDQATLERDGFPESGQPLFYVIVLEDSAGLVVGFALSYISYSTWTGRNVYLEDLYITPSARRGGLGTMMVDVLVLAAAAGGCSRLSWQALDWNEGAIRCYEKLGAHNEGQWLNFKLHRTDIQQRMATVLKEHSPT